MQIVSQEIEIEKPLNLTSAYVDETLQGLGLDVLHWAILDASGDKLLLNVNVITES